MTNTNEQREVNIPSAITPTVRVFDIVTNSEISKDWDADCLLKFSAQIRIRPLFDNQIIFFGSYQMVHRVIRNFDRNEVFIYWEHLVGYNPIIEFARK